MDSPTYDWRLPAWYAAGFAVLWLVLAALRPATTFHLAPALVAATAPIAYRFGGGTSRSRTRQLALAGFSLALLTTGILAIVGLLSGPSLLPFGGAALESLLAALVGGVAGLVSVGRLRTNASPQP